jgi:ribosomal protein L36
MQLVLSSASAFWICQFVRENSLVNRPYVYLWLRKTYVLPAGMQARCGALTLLKRTRSLRVICKCET